MTLPMIDGARSDAHPHVGDKASRTWQHSRRSSIRPSVQRTEVATLLATLLKCRAAHREEELDHDAFAAPQSAGCPASGDISCTY